MKGVNELKLNEATMIDVVQKGMNLTLLDSGVIVKGVSYSSSDCMFTITMEGQNE